MVAFHTIWHIGLTIVLGAGTFSVASAQGIFKCVDGETTSYQSMPCTNGQTETRLQTVARAAPSAALEVEAPAAPTPVPRVEQGAQPTANCGRAWPCRRTLMIGMSDDEVLNLPGWGVPKRIAREKRPREWREEWTYGSPINGERRLSFVNSTLVDVVDVSAATQMASLTIQ